HTECACPFTLPIQFPVDSPVPASRGSRSCLTRLGQHVRLPRFFRQAQIKGARDHSCFSVRRSQGFSAVTRHLRRRSMGSQFVQQFARTSILLALTLLAPTLARAQSSITGTVKDVSGAVLPGVTV